MALTPLGWGISPWADPRWWAEQQIKVMTATATYMARVAQACAGAAAVAAGQAELPAEAVPAEAVPAEPVPAEPVAGLPVAGWDELSLGSIRARLSRLSEADLAQLLHHEERHGGRPAVVSMLANRLAKIRLA
jgi:hypothetical protein